MGLKEDLQNDTKEALKNKDEMATLVLRSLSSEINNKAIELGKKDKGLSDEEAQKIVLSEIKKRKDAEEQYRKGGRNDLANNEKAESEILQKYAPAQLSDAELQKTIEKAIEETGATGMQDMGRVMKHVMAEVGPTADGSVVSRLVAEKLK